MADLMRDDTEALIQEVLEVYPEKARKDRAKHLAANNQDLEKRKLATQILMLSLQFLPKLVISSKFLSKDFVLLLNNASKSGGGRQSK